jgi:hypothetical protein
MRDPDAHPTQPPVDLLTAVRKWIWRHSSQPNGDPWDGDPEHLDRAAQRLIDDPRPAPRHHRPPAGQCERTDR